VLEVIASTNVIAGLDPAIHRLRKPIYRMDARVKPGHDNWKF
jgi:hypothetical protein